MSGKFGALKTERVSRAATKPQPDLQSEGRAVQSPKLHHRDGKKAVSGYFSPAVSQALNILALEQGLTLQALMGEAFDDIMRKYQKHPFGER